MQSSTRYYRGWNIVGFTFAMQFITMGLAYYAFGVFLKPLDEELGVGRFWVSVTLSAQSVVTAILSPYAARLVAEKSLRVILLTGTALLSGGFIAMSQVTQLWHLFVLFGGVVASGFVLLGAIPCNFLLANWFDRKRGTALGISQFGITISATILVPLVTWLVLTYGWRLAFVICGVGAFVLLVPLIWLFAIKRPEDVGLYPDGDDQPVEQEALAVEVWSFKRAVRERDVWLITLIAGPCYMGIASIVLSLPAHVTDLGLTALEASSIVAITTFMGACAKIIFGTLADYLGKKLVVGIAIVCQVIGVAIFVSVTDYVGMSAAGLIFGLGYGGMSPLWALLLATRYGKAAFAAMMGASMPLLMPFNLVGLPLTNWIYETQGSYFPAFSLLFVGYAVALMSLVAVRLSAPEPGHQASA